MPTSPLSSAWTLSCQGVDQSATAAGITGITRKRVNQAADVCALRFDGRAFDAAPPFPPGAIVTVRRAGTPWFVGRVTSVPGSGNEKSEAQECELSGPWWYLANLVYQQLWTIRGGAETVWSSRLVLGQAADGSTLNTGQVITATLQYAIDAGAPLAIGSIEPAFPAPLDEVRDLTCAEVIQRLLRWTPDCVAWFDYATGPVPTFHCRERAHLPATTLQVGVPPLAAVQGLTARHDLVVPAVVLHYEFTRQVNGQTQTDAFTDAAPAGATGREFGAVVGTIPLRGEAAVLLSQRIVTQPIVTDPAAPELVTQLIERDAALAVHAADPEITAAGISVDSLTRSANQGTAGGYQHEAVLSSLGNALTGGEITDWMIAGCGVRTQKQRLTYSYTLDGGTDLEADVGEPWDGSVDLVATDADSGIYTMWSSYRAGDAPPVGLAAAYLAAWSGLQYSGSVVLVEPEAGGLGETAGLGGVINLAGGAVADWGTMRAVVVAESVDVARGTTTLMLGPAKELSLASLAAALKATAGAGGSESGGTAALSTASSASRATGTMG